MKNLFLLILLISTSFAASSQQYGWTDISDNIPGSPDLSDVFFVSDDEGWITSSSQAEIYHTTDGGLTFEAQTTQYSTEALHMISETEGYAGGENGRVYRTTDGGNNWIAIGSIGVTLTDITFPPNSDTGYACGFSGQIFKVYKSEITQMNSNAGTVNLKSLIFPTKGEGWVCGESLILHFKNEIWNADQLYPSGSYNAIHFEDNTKGWAVGDNGLIIHTGNGGANWSTQENSDPRSLFNIFFISAMEGWAIGIDNIILHTINGGTNWVIEGEGLTTSFLRGVYFTSPNNGYVVGNGKTLLKYGELMGVADNDLKELKFDVYPNPCDDYLIIKVQSSDFKVQISDFINLKGKTVKSINIQGQENTIDVSDLPSGVYFIKLQTEEAVGVRKIIIK